MELVFITIIGIAVGSFSNVLIDRLSTGESINGRSHCDYCKKTLRPLQLIPVLSFIAQRGRCAFCKKKLSYQYPLIEILLGILFAIVWLYSVVYALPIRIVFLGIVTCLFVIFFADLKYQIIPDEVQVAFIIFSLLYVWFGSYSLNQVGYRLIAGIAVMSPILFLHLITKGKGMGFGDVKFAFGMGVLLGISGGLTALYIAFVTGAVYGIIALVTRTKSMKTKIAFGPFLIVGTALTLFMGLQLEALLTIFSFNR